MQERVVIEPKHLGKRLNETVHKKLVEGIEGMCTADAGYILSLISIESTTPTKIDYDTGSATFLICFTALALYPQKGEVVNAIVHEINKMGMFCFVGPFSIFVSIYQISGQFIEAEGESSILPNDGTSYITKESVVRLRIIGIKVEPAKIFGIGTITDDYLGSIC